MKSKNEQQLKDSRKEEKKKLKASFANIAIQRENKKFKEAVKLSSPKEIYATTGKLFEQAENLFRMTYLPLLLLSFMFWFAMPALSIVFASLLITNYSLAKVSANSFKDDFKDEADLYPKAQNDKEINDYYQTCENVTKLQQEISDIRQSKASQTSKQNNDQQQSL